MVAFVTFFFSWFIVEDGLFCFVFFFVRGRDERVEKWI